MAEKEEMLELRILLLRVVISMNPRHFGLEKRCQTSDVFSPMDTHTLSEYPWPQKTLDRTLVSSLDADNLQAERPDLRARPALRLAGNW